MSNALLPRLSTVSDNNTHPFNTHTTSYRSSHRNTSTQSSTPSSNLGYLTDYDSDFSDVEDESDVEDVEEISPVLEKANLDVSVLVDVLEPPPADQPQELSPEAEGIVQLLAGVDFLSPTSSANDSLSEGFEIIDYPTHPTTMNSPPMSGRSSHLIRTPGGFSVRSLDAMTVSPSLPPSTPYDHMHHSIHMWSTTTSPMIRARSEAWEKRGEDNINIHETLGSNALQVEGTGSPFITRGSVQHHM